MKKNDYQKYLRIAYILLFFVFFYVISRWMPVTGDDWGYALTGMRQNPFIATYHNYLNWSGRILAEFWGFTIAPHKGLWNILNALIFTGILVGIYRFIKDYDNKLWPLVLIGTLMLSAPEGIRMETYTWIMGTTYVIPLFLFIVYLNLLKKYIFSSTSKFGYILMCILNFIVPLYMENAAALIVGADLLVLIYLYFNDKEKMKKMIVVTLIGIVGLAIIRLSPGAALRMQGEHASFNQLSLFEKICTNWINFIDMTFMRANWLIRVLCISMMAYIVLKHKKSYEWILYLIVLAYGVIQSFGWNLVDLTDASIFYIISDLNMPHSLTINSIFFMAISIVVIVSILQYEEDSNTKWTLIFLFLCGLGANLVMLISPIFGARSSIYTFYMFIIFTVLLLKELPVSSTIFKIIGYLSLVLLISFGIDYLKIYKIVNDVKLKREAQIQYYLDNENEKDMWFIAYPNHSIHSGNIDPEDTYHLDTFKDYYGLRKDGDIHFYWLDNYDYQSIQQGK